MADDLVKEIAWNGNVYHRYSHGGIEVYDPKDMLLLQINMPTKFIPIEDKPIVQPIAYVEDPAEKEAQFKKHHAAASKAVDTLLSQEHESVKDYMNGKKEAINQLVGMALKQNKALFGSIVKQLLEERLNKENT